MEELKHLETLNLYYNNISSLKEVFLLRHNTKLKELDLRLNPVMRTEPDYRLFTIHMLIHLRKLDDRNVVDTERRAALMHFDSNQAYQLDKGSQLKKKQSSQVPPKCLKLGKRRVLLVQSVAPSSALQDNTDELLQLIHDDNLDMSGPPTAASTTAAATDTVTATGREAGSVQHIEPCINSVEPEHMNGIPGSSSIAVTGSYQDQDGSLPYVDFKANANFTPAPQPHSDVAVSSAKLSSEESDDSETSIVTHILQLLQQYIPNDILFLIRNQEVRGQLFQLFKRSGGFSLGMKQLHEELQVMHLELKKNETTLNEKDQELARLHEVAEQHEAEAAELGRQLQAQTSDIEHMKQHNSQTEVQHLLQQADTDITSLQDRVHSLQEECSQLRESLNVAPTTTQLTQLKKKIGQLESVNHSLREELNCANKYHHKDSQNYSQLQELVTMLQESHRSLVVTNDHLLKELDLEKARHTQEITEMHRNFEHLKKTIDLAHSS